MISDVLFDAIEEIRRYQRDFAGVYDGLQDEIEPVVTTMKELQHKLDKVGHPADMETIHCSCDCPYFGIAHDQVYVVRCECGTHEKACGYCLKAGPVTQCLKCKQK